MWSYRLDMAMRILYAAASERKYKWRLRKSLLFGKQHTIY
jgi:hypothetical protein